MMRVVDPFKQRLFDEQSGKCWICGEMMVLVFTARDRLSATFDHIRPVSLGGTWTKANLKLAHQICNNRRGNGTHGPRGPVYAPRQSSGHLPFSAAWLKDKGYMEAPERLRDNRPEEATA
jgi:5-methylcytosine-specific restriction endonuclease McrA